jgi:hypothetical protein
MAIPLGAWLPTCSSCRPGPRAKAAHARSLFGIAPGGACRATAVTSRAVGSYPTVSPLPPAKRGALRERRSVLCGAFPRVTPAGRYPAPLPCGVRTFLGFPRPSSLNQSLCFAFHWELDLPLTYHNRVAIHALVWVSPQRHSPEVYI